jgi:hypothetical protein
MENGKYLALKTQDLTFKRLKIRNYSLILAKKFPWNSFKSP